ncbi:MAG: NAD(P)-dependent oxidoreductase [Actinomycetales bacterium]
MTGQEAPPAPAPGRRTVVVGLGPSDESVVTRVLGDAYEFVATPTAADLAVASAAIVRADIALDAAALGQMPELKVLARTGVGTDLIDLEAATSRGIPVVITPGSGTRAVAEGVIAHALHLAKRLTPMTTLVRDDRWRDRTLSGPLGDLDGATIGIIGYGRIGRRVGELASAFGMRVLAHDPFAAPEPQVNCPDLNQLAGESDYLSLHVPLTPQNVHLVDEQFIARMRPGAILINCGRGALVDLDAALAGLRSGRLAGLGLDVFDPEPPEHHPIFDHPHVCLTPHLMGMTRRAGEATFRDAARGITDVLTGRTPPAVANPGWESCAPSRPQNTHTKEQQPCESA